MSQQSQSISFQHSHQKNPSTLYLLANASPISIQQNLYQRYSSSQSYFYSKTITEIIKEKRTKVNLQYDDCECYCEDQQNMKRFYGQNEHERKMSAFKQYYFYHEDCPRIFIEKIEEVYEKWHEHRRDLVYKKLKIMYGESYNSGSDSDSDSHLQDQNQHVITHFLLNVSEYNPYSKKYYLRVQAKKQKQKQNKAEEDLKKSKNDISVLNHQLSIMLNDMNNLSMISTLGTNERQNRNFLKTNVKKLKSNNSSSNSQRSKEVSEQNEEKRKSNSKSKLNFKKKNLEPVVIFSNSKMKKNQEFISLKSKQLVDVKTNLNSNKIRTHEKNLSNFNQPILQTIPEKSRKSVHQNNNFNIPIDVPLASPQFPYNSSPKMQENYSTNVARTKSIFSISSFNTKNVVPQATGNLNSDLKLYPSFSVRLKNQQKGSKVPKIQIKGGLEGKKNSQSEKKLRKPEQGRQSYNILINRPEPRSSSLKKLQQYQPELVQEFSDRKFTGTGSTNFRSYRSEHSEPKTRVKFSINPTGSGNIRQLSQKTSFKRSINNKY